MSRWLVDRRLVIALGRRHAAFALTGAAVRSVEFPVEIGELSMDLPEARIALLRGWLAAQIGQLDAAALPRQFVLTCDLSRVWTLTPPFGVRSQAELVDLAQAHCTRLFGSSARDWRIGGAWRATDSLACWAIPGWLEGLSAGRAPRVLAAEGLAASRVDLPRNGWAVLRFPQSAALVRLERGSVRQARTIPLEAGSEESRDRIAIEMSREILRAGGDSQAGFVTVDVRRTAPAADTDAALAASIASSQEASGSGIPIWERTRRTFLLGAASTHRRRLLAGIALSISAGTLTWTTAMAVRETMSAKAALEQVDAKRAVMASHLSSPAAAALSTAKRAKLNATIRRLNTPWSSVLDSLERQTPDGVVIWAIQSNGERATVRLQVGGADMETLVRYADSLARTPTFVRADLVQQEAVAANAPVLLTFDLALRQAPGEAK